jgi:hypothetical protein
MKEYSFTIKRYNTNKSFNTLEELKEEIGQYFTKKEKESGIVEKLITFNPTLVNENGFKYFFAKNNYQDFTVCYYDYID